MRDYNKTSDSYIRQSSLKRVIVVQPNGDLQTAYKTQKQIDDALERGQNIRIPQDHKS